MNQEIHHLPDGRLKVGEHFITDEVAIELIHNLNMRLQTTTTAPNTPWEAIQVINDVLELGSQKHQPGAWRKLSAKDHAWKAFGHLHQFLFGIITNSDGEDTLAHALTRLAMAVSVREG